METNFSKRRSSGQKTKRSKLNKGNFNKSSSPSETIKRYMSNEQLHTGNLIETVQVVVDFSMRGWGKTVFILKYFYLR